MARSNVPKFGNWENNDNVPYTVYFDKARKNKGGKMINPNDPQENPDMFPDNDPSPLSPVPPPRPRTRQDEPIGRGVIRPTHERRTSRKEGELRHHSNSPARSERSANESNYGGRGQRPARTTRPSAGSEQSFERSPHHPQHQARVMASPGYEGRNHDSSHGTGGKSRLRPTTRGDESPDNHAAVPRFGAWDDDPQSAENVTHIFNQIREEKNTGPGNVTGTPKHPSYGKSNQQNEPKKCCFPWW